MNVYLTQVAFKKTLQIITISHHRPSIPSCLQRDEKSLHSVGFYNDNNKSLISLVELKVSIQTLMIIKV